MKPESHVKLLVLHKFTFNEHMYVLQQSRETVKCSISDI